MVDRIQLAKSLRAARENRGLNQQEAGNAIGLSRSSIAQIELGNRPVSDEELGQLATLYETSILDLTGSELSGLSDLDVLVFESAPELALEPESKDSVFKALGLLQEAAALEQLLGRPRREQIRYEVSAVASLAEAAAQGEAAAASERRRLGLGVQPINNPYRTLTEAGIRVCAARLPATVAACLVRHEDIDTAVLINESYDREAQVIAATTAYGLAIFERGMSIVRVIKAAITDDAISRRTVTFSVAFLMPDEGVHATVTNLGKGRPSRRTYTLFDRARHRQVQAEQRAVPGSQLLTYPDVAAVAAEFGVDYETAAFRLLTLGTISEGDLVRLLGNRRQAAELFALTTTSAFPADGGDGLALDVLHLAVECYRRELLGKDRLLALGDRLRIPDLSRSKLLRLANAAR